MDKTLLCIYVSAPYYKYIVDVMVICIPVNKFGEFKLKLHSFVLFLESKSVGFFFVFM